MTKYIYCAINGSLWEIKQNAFGFLVTPMRDGEPDLSIWSPVQQFSRRSAERFADNFEAMISSQFERDQRLADRIEADPEYDSLVSTRKDRSFVSGRVPR